MFMKKYMFKNKNRNIQGFFKIDFGYRDFIPSKVFFQGLISIQND